MTPPPESFDVIVAGAGPAGLAAAAACSATGLRAALLAPDTGAAWGHRYAAWGAEFDAAGLGDVTRRRWPSAVVRLDAGWQHTLPRAYALLDNAAAQARLLRRHAEDGGARIDDHLSACEPTARGVRLRCASGRALHTRAFIDATGPASPFVRRAGACAGALQTAWGVLGKARGEGLPGEDAALLMDWSAPDASPHDPPSFLYAMNLGDGRFFLEETALIAAPPVPIERLADALRRRLLRRGIALIGEPEATERCAIPMDLPLPLLPQRVVAFGAAASMVHPATGYLVGYALRVAPRLAAALAAALADQGADPDEVAAAAWGAVWPRDAQRAHALHQIGAEVTQKLKIADIRRFFDAFFSIPPEGWSGYLDRTLAPRELAAVLWSIYRRAPAHLRAALRGAFIRHARVGGAALLGVPWGSLELTATR